MSIDNFYCFKCKYDFKADNPKNRKTGDCPKCKGRAKLIGTESFNCYGHNLPKP